MTERPLKPGRMSLPILTALVLALSMMSLAHAETRVMAVDSRVPLPPTVEGQLPGDDCEQGVALDDGSLETAFGWVPSVTDGRYAQQFSASLIPNKQVVTVCVCLTRTRADDSIDLFVEFYDNVRTGFRSGPADRPLTRASLQARNVPLFPDGAWYSVDLERRSAASAEIFHVGTRWDATVDQFFFLCSDETASTPFVEGYFRDEQSEGWGRISETSDPIFNDHKVLMVRAVPGRGPVGAAVPVMTTFGAVIAAAAMGLLGWLILIRRRA